MTCLSELSAELLLCIASFADQTDLLNLSLTCKCLRAVTEPELYREYNSSNSCHSRRPFVPLIKRLIERPELARHVKRLDLPPWSTLCGIESFDDGEPENFPTFGGPEPSADDYDLITLAAKNAGIIKSILPYEPESRLVKEARAQWTNPSYNRHVAFREEYLYDAIVPAKDIPYGRKFCELLRAGFEDPCLVLLLALLPRVQEIKLRGTLRQLHALPWKAPMHNFHALRTISAALTGGFAWPPSFFNTILNEGRLKNLHFLEGSSWLSTNGEIPARLSPLSLKPGGLNLQRLTLQRCIIPRDDMRKILDACRGLKSLHYSIEDVGSGGVNFTPAELIKLLRPHKESIEELCLEMYPDFNERDNGNWDSSHGCLTSFAEFSALKVLDTVAGMWPAYLIGEDLDGGQEPEDRTGLALRLPKSLESLTFSRTYAGQAILLEHIRELFSTRRHHLPKLRFFCYMRLHPRDRVKPLWDVYESFEDDLAQSAAEDPDSFFEFIVGSRSRSKYQTFPENQDDDDHPPPGISWTGTKYASEYRWEYPKAL